MLGYYLKHERSVIDTFIGDSLLAEYKSFKSDVQTQRKIPLISSLQVFCRKSSGTTAIQCISIRPFASQKIILSIINQDQRAEYLDFVSSHSLKTREKYTN